MHSFSLSLVRYTNDECCEKVKIEEHANHVSQFYVVADRHQQWMEEINSLLSNVQEGSKIFETVSQQVADWKVHHQLILQRLRGKVDSSW